ncbi:MAG: thiamine-phosphate kinase [Gammaproteobacteria bacterium]|nr:thiamine-phosphate kinase [Gammaproteobacteria bacterium]
MSEFDLINSLREIICARPGDEAAQSVVGIGDDGAVLSVPSGRELVVCTDTLVAGVHFPLPTRPDAIGYKALAVNLSDLAAMGAQPAWFFMALTLPFDNPDWIESFAGGMAKLASDAAVELAGGDVTSGPLSITVTALGLVAKGQSLLRSTAVAGDLVVVSGRPGAAAYALKRLQEGSQPGTADLAALNFPVPRLALGRMLPGLATACIDISDGLAADLGHILEQSGVGAVIDLDTLPCPDSLRSMAGSERWPLQLAGGDDYELCFTVPAGSKTKLMELSVAAGVELTIIGEITPGREMEFKTADGKSYRPAMAGYRHFENPGNGEK